MGAAVEIAALTAYAELAPHRALSGGAEPVPALPDLSVGALAVSHVLPGRNRSRDGVVTAYLTESSAAGKQRSPGLATQGIGSAVVLNILFWLALPIYHPAERLQPLFTASPPSSVFCSCPSSEAWSSFLTGASSRRTVSWTQMVLRIFPESSPTAWRRWSRRWPTA